MENTSGFYRIDENGVYQSALRFVYGAYDEYQLFREDKDTYTYPTKGGWYWFNTLAEAQLHFNTTDTFGIILEGGQNV